MEKTNKAAMMLIDVGWSDVGSWSSLWEASPRMRINAVQGDAILIDTTNCLVHGSVRSSLRSV